MADKSLDALIDCPRPDVDELRRGALGRAAMANLLQAFVEGGTRRQLRGHLLDLRAHAPEMADAAWYLVLGLRRLPGWERARVRVPTLARLVWAMPNRDPSFTVWLLYHGVRQLFWPTR
jgi:hypothetical protein